MGPFSVSVNNLTADRSKRVDVHMKGAGVFPSPAGLWRWGHEMGVGVRRSISLSELITNLLPTEQGRVTRQGVMFSGKEYTSQIITDQQWTTLARNIHGWDIQANYFPGSVSRIWTPNPGATGLIDLSLSANTTASPELTTDEVLEAFMVANSNNAEVQHTKNMANVLSKRKVDEIVNKAKQLTREACEREYGSKPSITEARKMEQLQAQNTHHNPVTIASQSSDEAEDAYMEMMATVFAARNAVGGDHV